jgi:hypothetical protein
MKGGKTEQAKMCADIKQDHSLRSVIDKAIELRDLFRVIYLEIVSTPIGGRMTSQKPTRSYLYDLCYSRKEPDFIPQPFCCLAGSAQPITNSSRNAKPDQISC